MDLLTFSSYSPALFGVEPEVEEVEPGVLPVLPEEEVVLEEVEEVLLSEVPVTMELPLSRTTFFTPSIEVSGEPDLYALQRPAAAPRRQAL